MKTEDNGVREDGTVELFQRWRPGGAQGNLDQLFYNGEQYLWAIRLGNDHWDFVAVTASCDSENPVSFSVSGEACVEWNWDDVEWFVPCDELDLPFIESPNQV